MLDLPIGLFVKRLLLSGDHSIQRDVALLQGWEDAALLLEGRRRLVGVLTLTSLVKDWILVLALNHPFKDHGAL